MSGGTAHVDGARLRRVEALFDAACGVEGHARRAVLSDAEEDVRSEVEALLAASARAEAVLERPSWGAFASREAAVSLPEGTRAGPFTVISEIGRGGMGVVYLARQERPSREVALKVLACPFPSQGAVRRFMQESEVLARLQHPGIASVIETGVIEAVSGAIPFFAMELIDGVPITRYVGDRGLPARARLELLASLCDAVEHAHQRGVIHRDLKPGNVLVDGSGRVRVLDFGVARLTGCDLQATSLGGDAGQIVGTLQYMSPEQMSGEPGAVDTRSDVYSLGVIACEVLSGGLPFARTPRSFADAVRLFTEEDRARLSGMDAAVKGDVRSVLLAALRKDPARRYQSAGALGADLKRAARGEMISVKPPTAVYLLRSLARRHKPLVMAAAVVVLALAAGAVVATEQALRVRRAEVRERAHVRRLGDAARVMMREVYTAVYALPGAPAARLQLANHAVGVLEELGASAPDDTELQLELAEGWRKIAVTYGAIGNANLHDRAKLFECCDRAIEILERLRERDPRRFAFVDALSTCWEVRGNSQKKIEDRLADIDRSVGVVEEFRSSTPGVSREEQIEIARRLARSLSVRASFGVDPQRRAEDGRRAVELAGANARATGTSGSALELAMAYHYLAEALAGSDRAGGAAAARAVNEVLAELDPADPEVAFARQSHGSAACILFGRLTAADGWDESAVESARRASGVLEQILAPDPTNDFLQRTAAEALRDYTAMWVMLANHPRVEPGRRIEAAREGITAARRGAELWALLRANDQLGPLEDGFEAELRTQGDECRGILESLAGAGTR